MPSKNLKVQTISRKGLLVFILLMVILIGGVFWLFNPCFVPVGFLQYYCSILPPYIGP